MNVVTRVDWRGRYHRFAGGAVDAGEYRHPASVRIENELREHFAVEVDDLDMAAAHRESERQKLLRPDGSRLYGEAEHAERAAAIDQRFEAEATRISGLADQAIAEADLELTKLDGADVLDTLSAEEQARAAARREFVREDVESRRVPELARAIRGAIAANDRPMLVLYARYLPQRLEREPSRQDSAELLELSRALSECLTDRKAAERVEKLRRRKSSAQVLRGRADMTRRGLGTVEAITHEMQRRGLGRL